MVVPLNRTRLGFDIAPSQSGPGRYVSALVNGLDRDEFEVVFPAESTGGGNRANEFASRELESTNGDVSSNWIRNALVTLSPKTLRLWKGFEACAREQARWIKKERIDIFHAQSCGCEEAPLAARMAGVRHVLGTFHVDSTYDLDGVRSGIGHRALENISNRCLHHAVAVSEATKKDWIQRTRISGKRITTVHNGVDPERFKTRLHRDEARQSLGLSSSSLLVGGVGRLDTAKGYEFAIRAIAQLASRFPQLQMVIAGSGDLRESLERLSVELGVTDRIIFLGFCKDVDVVYDALDVFMLSSLCEALPFALLEAMAHELPVVGTTVAGVPEVIVPGVTGFLAEPRDPDALATGLIPLLESEELRRSAGAAGRERVVRHFNERDMIRKTIEVYRRILSGSHTQSAAAKAQRP